MSDYTPDEGDYVEVTYTNEHGKEESLKGRVTEVDEECEYSENDLEVVIDEGKTNSHILVGSGEMDGEQYSAVSRYNEFSGSHHLGLNASLRELE